MSESRRTQIQIHVYRHTRAHLQSKLSQAAAEAANDVSSDVVVVVCCSIWLVVVFVACNLQTSLQKQIYTHIHLNERTHYYFIFWSIAKTCNNDVANVCRNNNTTTTTTTTKKQQLQMMCQLIELSAIRRLLNRGAGNGPAVRSYVYVYV